jgi:hypothetical protein
MTKDLPMFTDEYRNHVFAIDFTQHHNGVTARLQIDKGSWHEDHDTLWSTREEARIAGVDAAKRFIDRIEGR